MYFSLLTQYFFEINSNSTQLGYLRTHLVAAPDPEYNVIRPVGQSTHRGDSALSLYVFLLHGTQLKSKVSSKPSGHRSETQIHVL